MNPLLSLSATRLAALIRAGEVTSCAVVEAHVTHARRVNPALNAIVVERFAAALAEADAADARRTAAGPAALPPFHGVPCTIKECFALTGMPNTSGLVARRGVVATHDATAVARLRAAGAIPLGVTNVSELCMWMETNNRVYGRTNNPYDPTRIVGGSSGGEGAIVGAGASPFGLGSDIGGSIRMPAFFNGVFGHKPTGGLVPATGQYPAAEGEALRMLTTGPLCRSAEDLWPLLRVLAGPDGHDAACRPMPLGDPDRVEVATLRVLSVPGDGRYRVVPSLAAAQRRAGEALAAAGATLAYETVPGFRDALPIWSSTLSAAGGTTFAELLYQGARPRHLRQLVQWLRRESPHTLPALVLAAVEEVPRLFGGAAAKMVEAGRRLREDVEARLGPRGVMLFPSYTRPAPRHYHPLALTFHWVHTAIFNVLELPVTQVPLGLDADGLPVGVQVAAIRGNDHVTIAVARHLERALGGWQPPPRLTSG